MTNVDGIEFRSRLEARWSIVFNYFGWNWQYEPGYMKTQYGVIVPDFKMTDDNGTYWIEVKPSRWRFRPRRTQDVCLARMAYERNEQVFVYAGIGYYSQYGQEFTLHSLYGDGRSFRNEVVDSLEGIQRRAWDAAVSEAFHTIFD